MFSSSTKLLQSLRRTMGRIELTQLPSSTHVTVTFKPSGGSSGDDEVLLADSSLAPSETVVLHEGSYTPRYYFPASCIAAPEALSPTVGTSLAEWPKGHTSYCPWKGTAHYHSIKAPSGGSAALEGAAWAYPAVENDVKQVTKDGLTIEDKTSFWTWGANGQKLILKVDGKVQAT